MLLVAAAHAAEPLPALHADAGTFTVSGLSSGGYMAVQVHVAHSTRVKGVAALAAGPYNCAQGSLWTARSNCQSSPVPPIQLLHQQTRLLEGTGQIDPTAHLASAKVWLFSGTNDKTVVPAVVAALKDYYVSFKADPVLVADKPAGHAMVTEEIGNPCSSTAAPYINDCDYDAAGALLRHLVGELAPPGAAGRLISFDQKPYAASGMADEAFAYVPKACEMERCRVHVAFHGCRQSAREFAEGAGYNRWAASNRLVVLYPQARSSFWPFNPRGCWDWWGYTGPQYATKQAPQVRAVLAMVERLSASSPTR
ncbi:MAG TPA: PHB depolymerase family esterase [Burkholderiales bacterium]|nr:PHB depolymerase family esterase [Burkholderiales bacterium]